VRRIRNADEFSIRLRNIRIDYESQYKPSIEAIRGRYTILTGELPPDIDSLLEAHERQYLIDYFLNALNWQFEIGVNSMPNLAPEAPVHSITEKTTRFLDYLGLDEAMEKALLIVETKRRSSRLPLPKRNRTGNPPRGESFESIIIASLVGNTELTEEWQEWLKTLRDYSQSVRDRLGQAPRRVVITNGDWLIIFLDPENAFGSLSPSQSKIKVYQNWAEIEEKDNEIFGLLEYYEVLDRVPFLSLGQIRFYLSIEQVNRAMFGVRLIYLEEPEFYLDSSPLVKVVPVIFIGSKSGVWFLVESQNSNHVQRIPNNADDLQAHLDAVDQAATDLLNIVNEKLGADLVCSSLLEHYTDQDLFDELTPVSRVTSRFEEYLVVTGSNTHYLLKQASILSCPYHSWSRCSVEGYANDAFPITRSRVNDPRTIFVTELDHHCSHRDIVQAKSSRITPENREQCGSRSGKDQQAFCEIWKFEQRLCCRTCAFEEVCTKAEVFQGLPCKDSSTSV
jgi:hypothetical protein